ncbi:MAG: carbohydrate kinase [Opitutaceae bacterium]|nr:carbohydrate kinase [Opitutaceae bacterium]
MTPARFAEITRRFAILRAGVVGDFSLDRYFDLDPARAETSLETGLPVHNITRVRCQPGAAGNITTNLAALGAATLHPVGYCGDDGEGFELRRALSRVPGLSLEHFQTTALRQTFCYSKPLLHRPGLPPEELSRLDLKDWTPTPPENEDRLIASLRSLAPRLDALIVMDQAGVAGMGAISPNVLAAIGDLQRAHPNLIIIADSRHGLGAFPPLVFKMNAAEFTTLTQSKCHLLNDTLRGADALATRNRRAVFITLAEQGIVGAAPGTPAEHVPALPLRGPIDVVGAGDTVTATLALALAAQATLREAMELAQAAASLVVHQLGTTGVAKPAEMRQLLFS